MPRLPAPPTVRALLAAAPLLLAGMADADPISFALNSYTSSSDGSPFEDFTIASYDWGTTDYVDFLPDNGSPDSFWITVNSGDSTRPGWDYEITFDYSAYDIGYFLDGSGPGIHRLSLLDIKQPGDPNFITDVTAKDGFGNAIGGIQTDGSSIFFETSVDAVLAAGEFITIQFNQIPAPGGLALLVVAGLGGRGRRRR